jgi:hypothetical protein
MERSDRFRLELQRRAEGTARARKAGHDRNRSVQHVGKLLVGQALDLAKHEALDVPYLEGRTFHRP